MTAPTLLDDGRWRLDLGPDTYLEWTGCPNCLAPVPCPTWLGSGRRACEPPRCACEDADPDPADWKLERAKRADPANPTVHICDPYIAKKGKWVGRWTNRCPCWGSTRGNAPEGCCAHHPQNPRYLFGEYGMLIHPEAREGEAGYSTTYQGRKDAEAEEREAGRRPIEDVDAGELYLEAFGMPLDVEPAPYARRWPAEEITCACPTPWDGAVTKDGKVAEKGIGYHCVACHANFRSVAVAGMHQRDITRPCRPPQSIVDVQSGRRVLRPMTDGQFIIWG